MVTPRHPKDICRKTSSRTCGFTLIELLIVFAIIALLLTLAVPRYFHSIDTARETILVKNLSTTRESIDKFYQDNGRYPDSLNELIDKKYLRGLPIDPITNSTTSWVVVPPSDGGAGGVYDLRSSAVGQGKTNIPFSER